MLPLHNLHFSDFTVDIFGSYGVLSYNSDGSDTDFYLEINWKIIRNFRSLFIIFNMFVQCLVIEL